VQRLPLADSVGPEVEASAGKARFAGDLSHTPEVVPYNPRFTLPQNADISFAYYTATGHRNCLDCIPHTCY